MRVGEQSGMVFPVANHLSTPKIALATPPTPQHAKTVPGPGLHDHARIERDGNPGIVANRLQKRRSKIC
jgi:hypothetical protein